MRLITLITLALTLGCSGKTENAVSSPGEDGAAGEGGEEGAPGEDGEDGAAGEDGEDGEDGADGLPCWDLNGDGEPNPEEDINGDGVVDVEDCRGDGASDSGSESIDDDGDGLSEAEGDCDDSSPVISPFATDIVGDDIDQNCDGVDGTDADSDGYASEASGGDDCDDFDATIGPHHGILDTIDSIDMNCDGVDGLAIDFAATKIVLTDIEHMRMFSASDIDGDGKDELAVVHGSDGTLLSIFLGSDIATGGTLGSPDAFITIDSSDRIEHVSSGDYSGDGVPDLAVGVPLTRGDAMDCSGGSPSHQGAVFLFEGSHLALGGDLNTEEADIQVNGELVEDGGFWRYGYGLGTAVDLRHDIDGDGLNDLVANSSRSCGSDAESIQYLLLADRLDSPEIDLSEGGYTGGIKGTADSEGHSLQRLVAVSDVVGDETMDFWVQYRVGFSLKDCLIDGSSLTSILDAAAGTSNCTDWWPAIGWGGAVWLGDLDGSESVFVGAPGSSARRIDDFGTGFHGTDAIAVAPAPVTVAYYGQGLPDFDDDGLHDIIGTSGIRLGHPDMPEEDVWNYSVMFDAGIDSNYVTQGDFNGDGRSDLAVGKLLSGSSTYVIQIPGMGI